MHDGIIKDLSNTYGRNPHNLDINSARKLAKANNVKGRSRKNPHSNTAKRKIKAYTVIGLLSALGLSTSVLIAKNINAKSIENARITEIARQSNLDEYDLLDETTNSKFSILLQETSFLLSCKDLTEQDKIKLKTNLLTIEENLGNVIDYSNTQISNLFSSNMNKPAFVELTDNTSKSDGPGTKMTISFDNDTGYTFSSTDSINPLVNKLTGKNALNSNTLKSLIDNQLELYGLELNQSSYSLEKTFNLVKENFELANSLKDLSISIDKNGNIVENDKSAER